VDVHPLTSLEHWPQPVSCDFGAEGDFGEHSLALPETSCLKRGGFLP
jgi:hypothetical protein